MEWIDIEALVRGTGSPMVELSYPTDPHSHTYRSSWTRGPEATATDEEREMALKGKARAPPTDHDILRSAAMELSVRHGDVLLHHPNLLEILESHMFRPSPSARQPGKKGRKRFLMLADVSKIDVRTLEEYAKMGYDVVRAGDAYAFTWYHVTDKTKPRKPHPYDQKLLNVLEAVLENGGRVVIAHPLWNPNAYASPFGLPLKAMGWLVEGVNRLIPTARRFNDIFFTSMIEDLDEIENWSWYSVLEGLDSRAGQRGMKYRIGLEWNGSLAFSYNVAVLLLAKMLNERFENLEFYLTAGSDDHVARTVGDFVTNGGEGAYLIWRGGRMEEDEMKRYLKKGVEARRIIERIMKRSYSRNPVYRIFQHIYDSFKSWREYRSLLKEYRNGVSPDLERMILLGYLMERTGNAEDLSASMERVVERHLIEKYLPRWLWPLARGLNKLFHYALVYPLLSIYLSSMNRRALVTAYRLNGH